MNGNSTGIVKIETAIEIEDETETESLIEGMAMIGGEEDLMEISLVLEAVIPVEEDEME